MRLGPCLAARAIADGEPHPGRCVEPVEPDARLCLPAFKHRCGRRPGPLNDRSLDRRKRRGDPAVLPDNVVNFRSARRIVLPCLHRLEQRGGRVFARLDHHPAAESVHRFEMRIVGGAECDAPPGAEQLVQHMAAAAATRISLAGMIIYFNGMGRLDGLRIGQAHC